MRIVNVLGFFGILCLYFDPFYALSIIQNEERRFLQMLDARAQKCKNLENVSSLIRLKNHLFCGYDNTVYPNYPNRTNVTLHLLPKIMNFPGGQGKLFVQTFMTLIWIDMQLTWTPSDFDGISLIKVDSWRIWTPSLCVNESGEMTSDQYELADTRCLLFNTGSISCVPKTTFVAKCNPDYSYWPYDEHRCRITFVSYVNEGKDIDLMIESDGIDMQDYAKDMTWEFKFIRTERLVSNEPYYPRIIYHFLITRNYSKYYLSIIVPTITLMLLTLTVLCLNLKSIERMTVASVNVICHLMLKYTIHWSLPYNGVHPPNILIFCGESLALAIFAIILTAMLRKLENMSMQMPNWVSFTTTFVLSNKVGRFLILKDNESKIASKDTETVESLDILKLEMSTNESSWKYFAAIIDWLSFFCVILIYVITLIILVPTYFLSAIFYLCLLYEIQGNSFTM